MSSGGEEQIRELISEAIADLEDAVSLLHKPHASEMSAFHSRQAAERLLWAVGLRCGVKINPMWDAPRMWGLISSVDGVPDLGETVADLSPRAAVADPFRALRSALECVRRTVEYLGVEAPGLEDIEVPDMVHVAGDGACVEAGQGPSGESARSHMAALAETRADGQHDENGKPGRCRTLLSKARSRSERRTSYVKVFLMCPACGVRIPRKYQAARGRVPCPMCGRPMVKAT